MKHSGSCLLMERDDVKSQITTMMICSRRNENKSLFNVIIVMSRTQMSLYWWQLGPVKQRRFWATNVNRKWTLCILEQLLWLNIQGNCLYIRVKTLLFPRSFCSEKGRDWKVKGLGEKVSARKGKRLYRLLFMVAFRHQSLAFHPCLYAKYDAPVEEAGPAGHG